MVRRAPWGARRRYAIVTTEGMTPFRGIAPNKLESKVLSFLFVALRPPSNFTEPCVALAIFRSGPTVRKVRWNR